MMPTKPFSLLEFERVRNEAWYDHLSKRLGSTQLTHASAKLDQLERAVWLLGQIVQDLPAKCDWLDPELEKQARALIANMEGK